jgi:tRNA(Ile)-lysidine synthase
MTRGEIEAHARAARIAWREDPSNVELGPDRNFIRHEVLPRLEARWPAAVRTLARAAVWQAQAAALLDRVAVRDHRACCSERGLSVSRLLELPRTRQQALLRYHLEQQELPVPGSEVLSRLIDELCAARTDAQPRVRWGKVEARRYRDQLYFAPSDPDAVLDREYPWDPNCTLQLPHGALDVQAVTGLGIRQAALGGGDLSVRFRRGGERLRLPGRSHRSSLKKLLQSWQVPPWLRARIPLIYRGSALICVVGYTVAEGYQCLPDEPGCLPIWQPAEPSG